MNPIVSSFLPDEAVSMLNSWQQDSEAEALKASTAQAKDEALRHACGWLKSAQSWRQQSFEAKWRKYQMDSDGQYDPTIAAKKKAWQSRAFYPLTPSHRETILASIFKLSVGQRPMVEVTPRPGGIPEIAQDIRDITLREMEKTQFEVEWNSVLDDATTFGSGFALIENERKTEVRPKIVPRFESILTPGAIARKFAGTPHVVGYETVEEEVVTFNGTRFRWVSIWDVFPDPFALKVQGSPHAVRIYLTLGDIKKGVADGVYLQDAYDALKDADAEQVKPQDRQMVDADRGIASARVERPKEGKEYECFDLYARLPQKWVYPLLPEPAQVTNPDGLVACILRFHDKSIIGVQLSETYDGEAPLVKMDYFKVAGRYYARGIPEMLRDPQAVVNEIVNQRLDAGNLSLNKGAVVIEKALTNPKELKEGGPGLVVRLDNSKLGPNGDVKSAFAPMDLGDIPQGAGFAEVGEWEKVSQIRSSSNNTAMGIGSQRGDVNKTLGGQQLQREAAGDKFAYIGMVIEFDAMRKYFCRFYENIYMNLDPQEIVWSIGPERAARFLATIPSPEEVARAYNIEPQGIFEMDNKSQRQAKLQAWFQQFAAWEGTSVEAFFDAIGKAADEDPTQFKLSPEEVYAKTMAQAQMNIAQAQAKVPPQKPQKGPGGA